MTSEEAIALSKTAFWKDLTFSEIAEFQLQEPMLCMPFEIFHEAVEKWLGRPVWNHEFVDFEHLLKEGRKETKAKTLKEIMEMIPEEKRVVVII